MKQHTPNWHRGLHAIHFGLVNGLIALTFMAVLAITVLSPVWVQHSQAAVSSFPSYSFWNAPVPAYTALHPNSAQLVASIAGQASQFGTSFNNTASSPVYEVSADTPLVTVVPWNCGAGTMPDLANQWQNVPLPFFAVPGGVNSQMTIYQPSTSMVWEFGHMQNVAGQWQACTGGKLSTNSSGVFPAPYGVSSSSLAVLGGQLTPEELRSGYIDHTIGLALPQTSGFIAPATRGAGAVSGAPALGMRFRLDPSVNINSLGLNASGLAIARAAQTYGFVIWDTSSSVTVFGNNPLAQTSRSIPNPYANVPGYTTALAGFPWDKLQALPAGGNYATAIPAITAFSASQTSVKPESTVTLSWQSSNVNRCAISGIGDNLPASGSVVTKRLLSSTVFVLRCGGPNGAASSQLGVAVTSSAVNDSLVEIGPGVVIDQPYSGYANVFPEIMSGAAAERVYKVVYYEKDTYLYETAKPPFALNTSRMDNGKHTIEAQIYYRDGTSEKKSLGIGVSNTPETLFATTQSGIVKAPPSIPLPYVLLGAAIALIGMAVGTLWGWHKAHLVS
jgi:hypothetical protein